MKRVGLAMLVTLMTLVAAVAVTTSASAHDPDRRGNRAESLIVGTWQIHSSDTSVVGPASMETFTADGGFIWVSNSSTHTNIGSWEHLGGRRFAKSSQGFRVSPGLVYERRLDLRSEVRITRDDRLVGKYTYEVYDRAGVRLSGGEATIEGTRYAVEPMH